MTFEQLHHLVRVVADRRLLPAYPLYELSGGLLPISKRSRSLSERQQRLFSAVRQLGWPVFLRISEVPFGAEFPEGWGHAARETWTVPREVDSRRLLSSLLLRGAWHLYLALEPVDPSSLPDLFRESPLEACATVQGLGMPVLVEALPGNSAFRVLLQPAVGAKKAAA